MNTSLKTIKRKKNLKKSFDLVFCAGEMSGDILGASLIESLQKKSPDLRIAGVTGPKMRKKNIFSLLTIEQLNIMGFCDIVLALPKLIWNFYRLRQLLLHIDPIAIVCIDYPDFHLLLEKAIRKKGYKGKIIHVVSPSVWAWRKGRIRTLEQQVDLLLSILPFEQKTYAHSSLRVEYIGHPLVTQIPNPLHKKHSLSEKWVGIFPGSRRKEIQRNLPIQLQTLHHLQQNHPHIKSALCIAHKEFLPLISKIQQQEPQFDPVYFFSPQKYEMMQSIDIAIATSGTITLELALCEVPTIVTYAISPIDLYIARYLLRIDKIPFYCLVNIIAHKTIFPELYGPNLTPFHLLHSLQKILFDPLEQQRMIEECRNIKQRLSTKNASEEGAQAIMQLLSKRKTSI
ncbi:MAG: lipid-A-disaccharide synthase [Parachlamydiales bacterium]|nr:lipid-A-disaccharide synthase [Parachlamydiales bacterium]